MDVYGMAFALGLAFAAASCTMALGLYAGWRSRLEDYEKSLPEPERRAFERVELTHYETDLAPLRAWDEL